ncbi:MAG: hypothetical protein ACRDQZ_07055 [Mycobacteriales bacterium]
MAQLSFQDLPVFPTEFSGEVDPRPAVFMYRWPGRNAAGEANAIGEVLPAESLGVMGDGSNRYAVLRIPGGAAGLPRLGATPQEGHSWGRPWEPTAPWSLRNNLRPRDGEGFNRYVLTPLDHAGYDIVP